MEPVIVHHFLVCRHASYDLIDPVAPYSLHNAVFQLVPEAGETYPLHGIDLWVFVRLEGEDDHEFWIHVVHLADDDDNDNEPEFIAGYGLYRLLFGAELIRVSRAWRLRNIQFPAPGWYEFRLMCADEILAVEQIYLWE